MSSRAAPPRLAMPAGAPREHSLRPSNNRHTMLHEISMRPVRLSITGDRSPELWRGGGGRKEGSGREDVPGTIARPGPGTGACGLAGRRAAPAFQPGRRVADRPQGGARDGGPLGGRQRVHTGRCAHGAAYSFPTYRCPPVLRRRFYGGEQVGYLHRLCAGPLGQSHPPGEGRCCRQGLVTRGGGFGIKPGRLVSPRRC